MHEAESYEHAGVSVKIYYDDSPEDPREWENLGTMVCWHRRINLGDKQASRDFDTIEDLIESYNVKLVLPLYLYEHSGITMNVGGFADPWDSGQVGFIYVTAERLREEYDCQRVTATVLEKAEKLLRSEVEIYDQFLRGDVFGYVVDHGGPDEESCWGFFGEEYCMEEANPVAEAVAQARRGPDRIYVDAAPIEEHFALYPQPAFFSGGADD